MPASVLRSRPIRALLAAEVISTTGMQMAARPLMLAVPLLYWADARCARRSRRR